MEHWSAREWTLDSLKEKAGHNRVYIRTKTNCDEYKVPCTYMYMYCAYNTNCSQTSYVCCSPSSAERGTSSVSRRLQATSTTFRRTTSARTARTLQCRTCARLCPSYRLVYGNCFTRLALLVFLTHRKMSKFRTTSESFMEVHICGSHRRATTVRYFDSRLTLDSKYIGKTLFRCFNLQSTATSIRTTACWL